MSEWVNNGPDGPETPFPVFPEQRTSSDRPGMSVSCQNRKWIELSNRFNCR